MLELVGDTGSPAGPWVLGMWVEEAGDAQATSSNGPMPVWRVALPPDPAAARSQLDTCDAALDRSRRSLPEAAARLESVPASRSGLSYGGSLSPEDELLRELDPSWGGEAGMLEYSSLPPGSTPPFSWWEQRVADLTGFANRVATWCSPAAWVETTVGDQLLARSLVGFRGDVRTVWRGAYEPIDVALHQDAVRLAASSRAALVRAVSVATCGALGLALRLSNPATAALAIPATWRFVQRVADEFGSDP